MEPEVASEAFREFSRNLVAAMCSFYDDSNAPFELKSVVLTLSSRLFRKLRYTYKKTKLPDTSSESINGMFVKMGFLQTVLSDVCMLEEDEEKGGKKSTLYSLFVQDCVEFFTSLMLPLETEIASFKQLLPDNPDLLPEWLEKLVKVAYFLHNFKGELKLPRDIRDQIVQEMSIDAQWEHLIVIQGIPAQFDA